MTNLLFPIPLAVIRDVDNRSKDAERPECDAVHGLVSCNSCYHASLHGTNYSAKPR